MLRFMIVGGLSGLALVMTTSYLITGYLAHPYQQLTPATWRTEDWRRHALAVLWSMAAGVALGALDAAVPWSHASVAGALKFGALAWAALAGPAIATLATYVNLHAAVVAGLLIEWLLLVAGVALACWRFAPAVVVS